MIDNEPSYANVPDTSSGRMSSSSRKLIYIVLICVLIVPLFWLSQPATQGSNGAKGQRGGVLAAYREANHLSQTDLGQIDPTSETIRFCTLGMRGPAGALLWLEAQEEQKKKDWTQLRATLEQISKLQPHSIHVWRYQAWNISYNVSVAFDDYHDKYYWVIEGIKYMLKGVNLNPQEPRLAWDMGWFVAHKIGRADEAKQYRRLFAKDDDFQQIALPPEGGPANLVLSDNWHVGKAWFLSSENRVDERHPVKGMAEAIFYSDAPMCQYYYAENLEKDGHFDEAALFAWHQAATDWFKYGEREFPQTDYKPVQLNKREYFEAEAQKQSDKIDAMGPGVRARILKEKRAKLTADQRNAVDTPLEKRTPDQSKIAYDLEEELKVTDEAVARALPLPQKGKDEAIKLARYAKECRDMAKYIDRERKMVNFDFWKMRADAEQTQAMLDARQYTYQAEAALRIADLVKAKNLYNKSFGMWRIVLDKFPDFKDDPSIKGDLLDMLHRYMRCLEHIGEKLPQPFVLQDMLDRDDKPLPTAATKDTPKK